MVVLEEVSMRGYHHYYVVVDALAVLVLPGEEEGREETERCMTLFLGSISLRPPVRV